METSALMGMNVAQLIVDDYTNLVGKEIESVKNDMQVVLGEGKDAGIEEL